MGKTRCNFQSWIGSATGAVFFGLWAQACFSQESELISETLSWLILPALFIVAKQVKENKTPRLGSPQPLPETTSWWSLWLVAICIGATSVFKSERGAVYVFVSTNSTTLTAHSGVQTRLRLSMYAASFDTSAPRGSKGNTVRALCWVNLQ